MGIDYFSMSQPKPEPGRINQDSLLAMELTDGVVLGIADGMGGKAGGNIASGLAIEAMKEIMSESPNDSLEDIFSLARRKLATAETPYNEGMGSTLTVVHVKGTTARFAHVGDSRLYHLGSDRLQQVTRDQTELQELLDQNLITKAAAQNYHRKNILTSVLTSEETYSIQVGEFEIQQQDTLLLLTDGFSSLLSDSEMGVCSAASASCEQFISAMFQLVRNRKLSDDFSALAARF